MKLRVDAMRSDTRRSCACDCAFFNAASKIGYVSSSSPQEDTLDSLARRCRIFIWRHCFLSGCWNFVPLGTFGGVFFCGSGFGWLGFDAADTVSRVPAHCTDGGREPRRMVRHTASWSLSSNTNLRLRPMTNRLEKHPHHTAPGTLRENKRCLEQEMALSQKGFFFF